MDLALNNKQGLICHKTQTTNQPTFLNSLTFNAQLTGAVKYANSISVEG